MANWPDLYMDPQLAPRTVPTPFGDLDERLELYRGTSNVRHSDSHSTLQSEANSITLFGPVDDDEAVRIERWNVCCECGSQFTANAYECVPALFTPVCTDQCVIVPCNDPNHVDMACDDKHPHEHCSTRITLSFGQLSLLEPDGMDGAFPMTANSIEPPSQADSRRTSGSTAQYLSSASHNIFGADWTLPAHAPNTTSALNTSTSTSAPPGDQITGVDASPLRCSTGSAAGTSSGKHSSPPSTTTNHTAKKRLCSELLADYESRNGAECRPACSPSTSSGVQTRGALDVGKGASTQAACCPPRSSSAPCSSPFPSTTSRISSGSTSGATSTVPSPPADAEGLLRDHVCRWETCASTFTTTDALTAHLAGVHLAARKGSYDCLWDECVRTGEQGFPTKQKIMRHLQSHTGHRPFECQDCKQRFSEAATLQQHMRRHTSEKPYVCDYPGCSKAFAVIGPLTIHKRSHHGIKPFVCPHCNWAFAESSNLTKHLRTHTGARPYVCKAPACQRAFSRREHLSRHQAVHRATDGGP